MLVPRSWQPPAASNPTVILLFLSENKTSIMEHFLQLASTTFQPGLARQLYGSIFDSCRPQWQQAPARPALLLCSSFPATHSQHTQSPSHTQHCLSASLFTINSKSHQSVPSLFTMTPVWSHGQENCQNNKNRKSCSSGTAAVKHFKLRLGPWNQFNLYY